MNISKNILQEFMHRFWYIFHAKSSSLTEYKYISNEFVYCHDGVFDKLVGFEELKQNGTIVDYYLFKWQGAAMKGIQSSGDRICGFTIGADTIKELQDKHASACASMKVLDNNGNDIMRHDLLPNIKE